MVPEDMKILFDTARRIMSSKRNVLSKIRQLVGTEENYLLLIREHDRVTGQVVRARSLHAEATLTLVDWLTILNRFHWQCAYCQERAFQVLIHHVPLPKGGTTPSNCFPARYRCRSRRKPKAPPARFHLEPISAPNLPTEAEAESEEK